MRCFWPNLALNSNLVLDVGQIVNILLQFWGVHFNESELRVQVVPNRVFTLKTWCILGTFWSEIKGFWPFWVVLTNQPILVKKSIDIQTINRPSFYFNWQRILLRLESNFDENLKIHYQEVKLSLQKWNFQIFKIFWVYKM